MSNQEAKQPGPQRCLGALFHSQARLTADKEPVSADTRPWPTFVLKISAVSEGKQSIQPTPPVRQQHLDAILQVCAGLKRKLRTLPEVLPKESVPAGEFKVPLLTLLHKVQAGGTLTATLRRNSCMQYVCLGYSVYEKQQKKEGGKTPADTVELPYCEGLEVFATYRRTTAVTLHFVA